MLAEGRWCPDQCIGPLCFELRWEPWPPQHPEVSPWRWGKIVLCGQMLSESRKERIPLFVIDGGGLLLEQGGLNISWLPPVLFQELPHQFPSDLAISRPG
jgi:hypothetical protein